jgi:hypothetical protein
LAHGLTAKARRAGDSPSSAIMLLLLRMLVMAALAAQRCDDSSWVVGLTTESG